MADAQGEDATDRRPAIVICAYDAAETVWDPVEDLSGALWSPLGARAVVVPPGAPQALASILIDRLGDADCRGLLLIGRARDSKAFQLQTRAENRLPGGKGRIESTAPGVARATVPVAEMVEALHAAGLAAAASSEGGDDNGDYLLYRVLNALPDDADAPAVGLLRAPAEMSDDAVAAGVKAAAGVMARHMPPLPRRRPV